MKRLIVYVCLIFVNCCICAKLPFSFKKCNRNQLDFNQCLRYAAEDAIRQLDKPIRHIGLNSLEPLEVPSLRINARGRAVGFYQNFKNLKLYGFSNIRLYDLNMNFERKTLVMDFLVPTLRWEFDYDFDGTVLSMPIKGKGPGTSILENVRFKLAFALHEYEKEGEKYFTVVGVECVMMEPESVKLKFENLFDGDKALGDNVIEVMNKNWRSLFRESQAGYEDAFEQIFSVFLNRFLANVPIEELFGAEQIFLALPFIIF